MSKRVLSYASRVFALVLGVGAVAFGWHSRGPDVAVPVASGPQGRPARWIPPEIILQPSAGADSAFGEMLTSALTTSAKAWNHALEGCSVPRLRIAEPTARTRLPRRDGFSTIFVRNTRWCPDSGRDSDDCYDRERAAITTLYPNEEPGRVYADLREADVEINGVHYSWSLEGVEPGTSSLRALVAHELGHVLGLDHPCEVSSEQASTRKKPTCGRAARKSIMYPLPVEPAREAVLEPGRAERTALCALYETNPSPRATSAVQRAR